MIENPPRRVREEETFPDEESELLHPEFANDNEVVFNAPTPKIEAANDNEVLYKAPSVERELANDNQVMAPGDEEKLRGVLERLNLAKVEGSALPTVEEIHTPEGDEVSSAESAEKSVGESKEGAKVVILAIDAANKERKEGGGNGSRPKLSLVEKGGKKRGLLWSIFKGALKWTAIIIGAVAALYMTAINKITDKAVAQTGSKGGHAPAKKASGGHGGGGH
ncbi:hypothetical protein BH11PAT2_BH11PAT2_08580 [soil metagenome]